MIEKTYGQILEEWEPKAYEYSAHERIAIHRRWRSLGKRITSGARIPDEKQTGSRSRK